MQGLVYSGGRHVSLESFDDPTPSPGEVVVRIAASGMCGSDLHYYRAEESAASGLIGGHEPAGTVAAVGDGVTSVVTGDRVMVHHYAGCGVCPSCRTGWSQMCTSQRSTVYGKNAHGAHAPLMNVAAASVLPLAEALSFEAGAAIGCGTGTAWGALDRLGDVGGQDVLISGQGPVGLSATMLANARGARVIAVDPAADRRRQGLAFGAAEAIDPTAGDAVAAIRETTAGRGPAAVIETSGASAAAETAIAALAPWGRFAVVGLGGTVTLDVRKVLSRQLTVMTSWSLSSVQQLACAEFIAERNLPVDDLFTDRWSIDQAEEAYRHFDKQDAGKGVFLF